MDATESPLASAQRFLLTCSRCGDSLDPAGRRDPSGLCPACTRLLGERALAKLLPARRVLAGLLIACASVSMLSLVSSLMQLALLHRMQDGDFTQSEAELNDQREAVLAFFSVALYVATCVAWAVWFRRSHHFVKIADRPMEFGPNAWGWFFAPIANLFKPYQAVKELWLTATRYQEGDRPGMLAAWWGTWLLANATGNAVFRTSMKEDSGIPGLITSTYLEAADAGVGIVSAVMALLAVRVIDRALRLEALS